MDGDHSDPSLAHTPHRADAVIGCVMGTREVCWHGPAAGPVGAGRPVRGPRANS